MIGDTLKIVTSEGKILEENRIYHALCGCGQPILGKQQLCQQCVIDAQVLAQRLGRDFNYLEEPLIILTSSKNGAAFFDTGTFAFVPFVSTEDRTISDEEENTE